MTDNTEAIMLAARCGHHHVDDCQSCGSALDCTNNEIRRLHAKLDELRAGNDRLMIAAAATVKASMDEYKRGHADGERKGLADGLEQAARIARAAQYSKTPATDTMRNIERLMDGLRVKEADHGA